MELTNKKYIGFYAILESDSPQDEHAHNKGENVSVGQEINLEFSTYLNDRYKEIPKVAIYNLAHELIGFLPKKYAAYTYEAHEAGWTCRVAISAVMYNEGIEQYFAQAAIICYKDIDNKNYDVYTKCAFDKMANGHHIQIDYTDEQLNKILTQDIKSFQFDTVKWQKLPTGQAYYKRHSTATEKLIIAGSQNKIGCWIGSIAVIVVTLGLVAIIVLKILGII